MDERYVPIGAKVGTLFGRGSIVDAVRGDVMGWKHPGWYYLVEFMLPSCCEHDRTRHWVLSKEIIKAW